MPAALAVDIPPADESAPVGPSADEEAAFLSTERENGGADAIPGVVIDEEKGDLPPMEDLVKRIPALARDLMEDLFRARFVTVKRIPKTALKN